MTASIAYIQYKYKVNIEEAEHMVEMNQTLEILERIKCKEIEQYFSRVEKEAKEKSAEKQRRYIATEHGRAVFRRAWSRRRARLVNAGIDLTDEEELQILLFYSQCPKGYHVDHIIPLSKGGKHKLENLQYLTASENLKKSCKLIGLDKPSHDKVIALFWEIRSWIEQNIDMPIEEIMRRFGVGKRYAVKIFREVKKELDKLKPKPERFFYFKEYWKAKKSGNTFIHNGKKMF